MNRFAPQILYTFVYMLCLGAPASAENNLPITLAEPKKLAKSPLIGGVIFEFPVYSFYLGSPNINGRAYVPNVYPRIGLRLMYKRMGVRTTLALPLPGREIERRGETTQSNTTLSFHWRQHAFDFYYQYFRGFYLGSPLVEIKENKPNRYTLLPNAVSRNWGFNWYYNVDPSRFSLNSAFDQTQFNAEAGNSWVLIPFYRHWTVNLGDTIIKGSEADDPDTLPEFRAGIFDTLGASLAYAQMWVFKKYYVSTLTGLGPGVQFQKYELAQNNRERYSGALKLNFNLSLGQKRQTDALGVKFILDSIYSRVSDTDVYSSFVAAEFFYNRQF